MAPEYFEEVIDATLGSNATSMMVSELFLSINVKLHNKMVEKSVRTVNFKT